MPEKELIKTEVEVEEPHEHRGTEYVKVSYLLQFSDGTGIRKQKNFPAAIVGDLGKKLTAVAVAMKAK